MGDTRSKALGVKVVSSALLDRGDLILQGILEAIGMILLLPLFIVMLVLGA